MTDENEEILSLILDEIIMLEKYKYNLKKTALIIVIKKDKNFSKQYYNILDEIERISIEVYNLETQKSNLLNFIEQTQELVIPETSKQTQAYLFQKPVNF